MPYMLLSLVFVASRLALARAGLDFHFALDWMWLADPGDLRDRLVETLYYFHAFPPGMNVLTGLLLKVSASHAGAVTHALFGGLGLILVNALFCLGRALGLSTPAAFALALAFSLSPPAIYFEHLYLYEQPVTTLLCLAAVCVYRAARGRSPRPWLAFFALAGIIGATRSTFHLIWFLAMVGFALWVANRARWRTVLAAAIVPGALLLALYGKNWMEFGEFAASTFGPASLHLVTVDRLPRDVRDRWIAEGRLSTFADISAYAPPRAYLPFFEFSRPPDGPPQLTRIVHPATGAANFNHWFLLEVHRARRADALYTLGERPLDYARAVEQGLRDFLRPSTEWHPRTGTPRAPHAGHRAVLGGYEAWFNGLVHGGPAAPVGVYVILPAVWLWGTWRAWRLISRGDAEARARAALLLFCLGQIAYVTAASTMLTFLESSRYRFQIEPFIWLVTAACVAGAWRRTRAQGLPARRSLGEGGGLEA